MAKKLETLEDYFADLVETMQVPEEILPLLRVFFCGGAVASCNRMFKENEKNGQVDINEHFEEAQSLLTK